MSDGPTGERPSAEELRRQIERTRSELSESVDQLARKADPRTQVQERAERVQQQVRDKPFPYAAAAAATVAALWLIRRR